MKRSILGLMVAGSMVVAGCKDETAPGPTVSTQVTSPGGTITHGPTIYMNREQRELFASECRSCPGPGRFLRTTGSMMRT